MKIILKILNRIKITIHSCKVFYYKMNSINIYKRLLDKNINKNGQILIEGFWDNPHHWLRSIMIRNAIAYKYGSDLIGLYNHQTKFSTFVLLRSLVKNNLVKISFQPNKKEYFIKKAKNYLNSSKTLKNFIKLKLDYDYPAFYFYDGFLKKYDLGTFEINHPQLIKELAECLESLSFYNDLLNEKKINAVIVSHLITIKFSVLCWMMLHKKIPVFYTFYSNKNMTIQKITKISDMLKPSFDFPTCEEIKNLDEKKKIHFLKKGENYLRDKKKSGEISIFNAYKNMNSKYKNKQDFLKLNNFEVDKPLVVILGPCLPDFPNFYGTNWFIDYVEWIKFTLDIVKNVKNINWTLKPHPAEIGLGMARLKNIFKEKNLPQNVKYWPEDASSTEAFEFSDLVITARGSSTILYGVEGKKVMSATNSIYSQFKMGININSAEEYKKKLLGMTDLLKEKFEYKDIELAKIFVGIHFTEENKDLNFPYGFYSQKLYKNINHFINTNLIKIREEINLIRLWENTDHDRYNTYKKIIN